MDADNTIMVHKITLPTGKTVIIKDVDIGDEEMAAKIAMKNGGDSGAGAGYFLVNELTKMLILEIDGKKLSGTDKTMIKRFLSYQEFTLVRNAVGKLMTGEETAQPTITTEFVTSGKQ